MGGFFSISGGPVYVRTGYIVVPTPPTTPFRNWRSLVMKYHDGGMACVA